MKYTEKIRNRQLTTVLVWTGKIYSTVEEHFHWLHQCAWKLTAQILKENAAYTFFFFNHQVGVQTDAFEQIQQYTFFPREFYETMSTQTICIGPSAVTAF